MALVEVALLYIVCGVGCAAALVARPPRRFVDALIVVPLWPLYGPFLFLREAEPDETVFEALLPAEATIAPLRHRLTVAEQRLREIDELLAKPTFNLEVLERRLATLEATGASRLALSSAESRKKSIERLVCRRKVLAAELEELAELFLQLETQTEVVRLAGSTDESVSDLALAIVARLESIDELAAETSIL